MANNLPFEKKVAVISMLCESASIRGIEHLIVCRFESGSIVIPIERARIHIVTKVEELGQTLSQTLNVKEHVEAAFDEIERVYLGSLNLSNAQIVTAN